MQYYYIKKKSKFLYSYYNINMEIMIGIWYFLFEDNLKQFQKILYLL